MAFIQNTAFEARVANGEFNTLENITGLFQTSSQNDICSAGFLVKQNGLMPNEGYTGLNNENSYLMTAASKLPAYRYNQLLSHNPPP